MKRLPILLTAVIFALAPAATAGATPVKCAATDVTVGDRIFPEPEFSLAFLRFDEFQCGIKLLEKQFPGGSGNSAPNWTVEQAAWEAACGRTAGTNGTGRTAYGEVPLGKGRIRFLGALLPDPTEDSDHRYGLQNYAVTYTGYTLLQNVLACRRPAG